MTYPVRSALVVVEVGVPGERRVPLERDKAEHEQALGVRGIRLHHFRIKQARWIANESIDAAVLQDRAELAEALGSGAAFVDKHEPLGVWVHADVSLEMARHELAHEIRHWWQLMERPWMTWMTDYGRLQEDAEEYADRFMQWPPTVGDKPRPAPAAVVEQKAIAASERSVSVRRLDSRTWQVVGRGRSETASSYERADALAREWARRR